MHDIVIFLWTRDEINTHSRLQTLKWRFYLALLNVSRPWKGNIQVHCIYRLEIKVDTDVFPAQLVRLRNSSTHLEVTMVVQRLKIFISYQGIFRIPYEYTNLWPKVQSVLILVVAEKGRYWCNQIWYFLRGRRKWNQYSHTQNVQFT